MTSMDAGSRNCDSRPTLGLSIYLISYVGLLIGLTLIFLAILDVRRGFLFASATGYWAYATRSPFGVLSLAHGALVGSGLIVSVVCFLALRYAESRVTREVNQRAVWVLALLMLCLLVIDLFTYRGVAAGRALSSGKLSADWLLGFNWSGWWKPLGIAVSYGLTVWHATTLGLLLSGLALVYLPFRLGRVASRDGFAGGLLGTVMAVPQPFCSCCAVAWAPTLIRHGASNEFLLAFVVAAPMINITTLVLAGALLPSRFALLRVAVGIGLPVLLAYAVTRLAASKHRKPVIQVGTPHQGLSEWLHRMWSGSEAPATPTALVRRWLSTTAWLAAWFVPVMLLVGVVAAAVFEWMPDICMNNVWSVIIAAIAGTLMMISTWSEIPIAAQLIQAGCYGPAATLLVVLPPVSLPCLAILANCTGQVRLSLLLALAVMLVGVCVGLVYL